MDIAAEGFKNGEQFAAVAHAARNTQIPFMVLKHRVVDEHKTLTQAIRASRPDLNVKREVARANDAARSDIAAISG
jgi:O6-methylguanine-DNA--protein-cysteine methyltransferase